MYILRNIFLISLYSLIIFAVFSKEKSLLYVKNTQHDGYMCEYGDIAASLDNIENRRMCLSAFAARRCVRVFYSPDLQRCLCCFSLHISSSLPVLGGSVHYEANFKCPSTHYQFNTSCYTYSENQMTWNAAKTYCEGLNGYIATIESSDENSYVANWLYDSGVGSNDLFVWLGATDSDEEGSWWNVNGKLQVFTKWTIGQPDNGFIIILGNDDCVAIKLGLERWYDEPCSASHPVVCEFDLI